MTAHRLEWSGALESWRPGAILEQFADDVVIRVAVHDTPVEGRDVAAFLFGALTEELATPRVTEELIDGDSAVVLFETAIGETAAHGLNVLRLREDGRIGELTVFFRPLEALNRISEAMGARIRAQAEAGG